MDRGAWEATVHKGRKESGMTEATQHSTTQEEDGDNNSFKR